MVPARVWVRCYLLEFRCVPFAHRLAGDHAAGVSPYVMNRFTVLNGLTNPLSVERKRISLLRWAERSRIDPIARPLSVRDPSEVRESL